MGAIYETVPSGRSGDERGKSPYILRQSFYTSMESVSIAVDL